MNFKDIKSGFSLYILDKPSMTYSIHKVNSVSLPHIDSKMSNMQMVVDIVTDNGNYCMIADADTAYPANSVITTEKANILREVEACKSVAEQALSQMESHKQTVTKCNLLLSDLDPVQKEKAQTEERFSNIETKLDKLSTMIENFIK